MPSSLSAAVRCIGAAVPEVIVLCATTAISLAAPLPQGPDGAANDVEWNVLGVNENDSMPLGNGDVAANVWTEH